MGEAKMKKNTKRAIIGLATIATAAVLTCGYLGCKNKIANASIPNTQAPIAQQAATPDIDIEPTPPAPPKGLEVAEIETTPEPQTEQMEEAPPVHTTIEYDTESNHVVEHRTDGIPHTVEISLNYGGSGDDYQPEEEVAEELPEPKDMKLYFGDGRLIDHEKNDIVRDEETGVMYDTETGMIAYETDEKHYYYTGNHTAIIDGPDTGARYDDEIKMFYVERFMPDEGEPEKEIIYDLSKKSPVEQQYIMIVNGGENVEINGGNETVEYDPYGEGRLFVGGVEVTTQEISDRAEAEWGEDEISGPEDGWSDAVIPTDDIVVSYAKASKGRE
jgi:hypothetical protein